MFRPVSSRAAASVAAGLLGASLAVSLATGSAPASADPAAEPTVELVSFRPGTELWSRFGHVGLRVIDPAHRGTDFVYDFGHARYEDGFLMAYLRGTCRFFVAVRPWRSVVARYRSENRTIVRQRLNLAPGQARELVRRLERQALPENRNYVYDQLLDNCSTRIRDLLDDATGGALREAARRLGSRTTYREHTLEHAAGWLTLQLVLDLLTGPNHDREVDAWGAAYLPSSLQRLAEEAVVRIDGRELPLAGPPEVVYERRGPPVPDGSPAFGRRLALALLLPLGVLLGLGGRFAGRSGGRAGVRIGRAVGAVLLVVALLFGLLGALLLFVVLVSGVPDFAWNQNVFVFVPLDLLLAGTAVRWLVRGRFWIGRPTQIYLLARLAVLAGLVLAKLAGVAAVQDNWTFAAGAAAVLAGFAAGASVRAERTLRGMLRGLFSRSHAAATSRGR